jgi:hypothetical protein
MKPEFIKVTDRHIEVIIGGKKPRITNGGYNNYSGWPPLEIEIPEDNFKVVTQLKGGPAEKRIFDTIYELSGYFKLIYDDGESFAFGYRYSTEKEFKFS